MKRGGSIAILLTLAALALAGAAAADRPFFVPSQITIEGSRGVHFEGEVNTALYEPCERRRRVLLYKVVAGGPDEVAGRDTTDAGGDWSITPQGSAGISLARFYAKTKPSIRSVGRATYVCRADRSGTIRADS